VNTVSKELLKTVERDDSLTPVELESLRKLRIGEAAPAQPVERLVRRREVAERLAVTLRTVDRWCKQGHLPRMQLSITRRPSSSLQHVSGKQTRKRLQNLP